MVSDTQFFSQLAASANIGKDALCLRLVRAYIARSVDRLLGRCPDRLKERMELVRNINFAVGASDEEILRARAAYFALETDEDLFGLDPDDPFEHLRYITQLSLPSLASADPQEEYRSFCELLHVLLECDEISSNLHADRLEFEASLPRPKVRAWKDRLREFFGIAERRQSGDSDF